MSKLPDTVVFPWLGVAVPVRVDESATGDEEVALKSMADWTPVLRTALERACFADYLGKIESIDAEPPTVPIIGKPSEIWKHIRIDSVRPEGCSHVIVYAVPSWQETLHHEWCIEGTATLHYVGQFLDYSADGYHGLKSSAVGYDEVIDRLGHLPQSWIEQ